MGYLETSDQLVQNTYKQLDRILQSQTSMFLTGLGEAVLCTWWNMNDSISTADNGTGTIDAIIGKDSPLRYNKVEGLPVYNIVKGLQEIEMSMDENGMMDMNIEIEAVIIANTIIPGPFDHMQYTFASGRSVMFRANDVKISTVRSNGVYRVPMHLIDIDSSDYEIGLAESTVRDLKVRPEMIGTNEKCIVTDVVYELLDVLDNISARTLSNYVDTFYIQKYNAFAMREYCDTSFNVYDPYLTKFLIKNNLLDTYDEMIQPVTLEQSKSFRSEYNTTVFRAVELHDMNLIKLICYDLGSFSKKLSNPFDYYGEEVFYYLSVYKDKEIKYPRSVYFNYDFLYQLRLDTIRNMVPIIEKIITKYFQTEFTKEFLTKDMVEQLEDLYEIEYTDYYFYLTPIVLYILGEYRKFLLNDCI